MSDLKKKLLESHTKQIMQSIKGPGFRDIITGEIDIAFEYFKDLQLKEILTPEIIVGIIRRLVVELPVAGGITELAGETSRTVLASKHNAEITIEELFTPKLFDDIVDKAISLENPRNQLINRLLSSAFFTSLISDVLYAGIYESLVAEQSPLHKIPGLAPIIQLWSWAADSVLPDLKPAFKNRIKNYLENNLEYMVQHSKTFLIEALNEDRIAEISNELWQTLGPTPLSKYFNAINANDMEDFILIGYDFWIHFRTTPYFEGLYTELVHYFFEKYGDKNIDVIIEDVGVSQALIACEITEIVVPVLEKCIEKGYIQQRIRAFLESFYNSPEVTVLIKKETQKWKKQKP